jgi:gamma-glutamylcyclotransferase (GGCT)/AIG2-like uncharacterized protein YtfP
MLYFAYGSNMDRGQMRSRCPGSVLLGAASLPGWRLGFAGYSEGWGGAVATIVPTSGGVGCVQGLLYYVGRDDLAALDACEGHPGVYRRAIVDVLLTRSGGRCVARAPYTYVLLSDRDGVPSDRYFRQIEAAYYVHKFDVAPLHRARDLGKDETTRVFVYGSLLSGLHNHDVLGGARCVGLGETAPSYTMVSLGAYPGVVEGGRGRVVGEVYEVNATTLARLDRLEGHPRFYTRKWVRLVDGSEAWMYVLPWAHARRGERIPGGDWRSVASAKYDLEGDFR